MSTLILIIIAIILAFWFFIIGNRKTSPDWKIYVSQRLNILSKSSKLKDKTKISSIFIELDKLLDYCLKMESYGGTTLAQRLKQSRYKFDATMYNELWRAHKLRNRLVHDINFNFDNHIYESIDVYIKAIKIIIK